MTKATDLLSALANVLGPSISPSLTAGSDGSDLYEAFLFSEIVEAAEQQGASVYFESVSGTPPAPFVVRTSPGQIYSTERDYGHAVVDFPGCSLLEVHLGVRTTGDSGVLHECDVLVLRQREAAYCRRERVPPRRRAVVLAVEAKFYSSRLPLAMGRAFTGFAIELGAKHAALVSNSESHVVSRLLNKRQQRWYFGSLPSSNRLLRSFCEETLRNYKAAGR